MRGTPSQGQAAIRPGDSSIRWAWREASPVPARTPPHCALCSAAPPSHALGPRRAGPAPPHGSAPRTHPSPTTTHLMACMGAGRAGAAASELRRNTRAAAVADRSRAQSRAAGDSRVPPSARRGDSRAWPAGGAGFPEKSGEVRPGCPPPQPVPEPRPRTPRWLGAGTGAQYSPMPRVTPAKGQRRRAITTHLHMRKGLCAHVAASRKTTPRALPPSDQAPAAGLPGLPSPRPAPPLPRRAAQPAVPSPTGPPTSLRWSPPGPSARRCYPAAP